MRTYDNGTGFTVSFTEEDAENFSCQWPCSTVEGSGFFSFDNDGDLVDADTGDKDGDDWLAFSKDCQLWGEKHIKRLRRRHQRQKKESRPCSR